MKQLVMNYPDDLEQAIQLSPEELAAHVRLMAALKMFEAGELSPGQAAEFAQLSRAEFLEASGRYRVSAFDGSSGDREAELRADLIRLLAFRHLD